MWMSVLKEKEYVTQLYKDVWTHKDLLCAFVKQDTWILKNLIYVWVSEVWYVYGNIVDFSDQINPHAQHLYI